MLLAEGIVNRPNVVTIAKKHVSTLPLWARKSRELQAQCFSAGYLIGVGLHLEPVIVMG